MNITPDALPLPGPAWLFEFLLHFTFILHLLASLTLMKLFISVVHWFGERQNVLISWFQILIHF